MTGSSPSARHREGSTNTVTSHQGSSSANGGPGAAHTQPSSMVITVGRSSATFQRPVTASIPPGSARRRLDGRPLASTTKRANTGARSPSSSIAQPSAWRRGAVLWRASAALHRARLPGRRAGRRTGRGRRAGNQAASGARGAVPPKRPSSPRPPEIAPVEPSWSAPVIAKRSSVAAASVSDR